MPMQHQGVQPSPIIRADVAIIGAGPAGLAAAIRLGQLGGMLAAEALHDVLVGGESPLRAFRRYESACRKAFAASFRRAGRWRYLVGAGGLDLLAGTLNRPATRRMLARSMARM